MVNILIYFENHNFQLEQILQIIKLKLSQNMFFVCILKKASVANNFICVLSIFASPFSKFACDVLTITCSAHNIFAFASILCFNILLSITQVLVSKLNVFIASLVLRYF